MDLPFDINMAIKLSLEKFNNGGLDDALEMLEDEQKSDPLVKSFIGELYLIEAYTLKDKVNDFSFSYLNVKGTNSIIASYEGNFVNTSFNIVCKLRDDQWFVNKMGTQSFNPPLLIKVP